MPILIYILLVFLTGSGRAISDTLWFWWGNSIFAKYPKLFNPQWWNPRLSYKNKYKPKNYFIQLLTRTFLVTLTDAWHLFQFISYFPMFIVVAWVYSQGLDVYDITNLWEILIFAIASYGVHMGGNTFTKSVVKTADRWA